MGFGDFIKKAAGIATGGLLGGGGSTGPIAGALAGLAGSAVDYFSAKSLAGDQMDFQREMASTQYQRAVEDMRKAGINPMLAAKTGGNASPPGALASPGPIGTNAVNSARANMLIGEQLKQAQHETDIKKETIDLVRAQKEKALQDKEESDWRTRQTQQYLDHMFPLQLYSAGQEFQNLIEKTKQQKENTFQAQQISEAIRSSPTLRNIFAVPAGADYASWMEVGPQGGAGLMQKLQQIAPDFLKGISAVMKKGK